MDKKLAQALSREIVDKADECERCFRFDGYRRRRLCEDLYVESKNSNWLDNDNPLIP